MKDLVTVITGSMGRPSLTKVIESVANQTYPNVQHLVFCDGPDRYTDFMKAVNEADIESSLRLDIIHLPYAVGKNRWNSHRMFGAGIYLADEPDYIIFLDDDNTIEPEHIQQCVDVIKKGNIWSYSLRKIVDVNGKFLCYDDCESLGKWASVLHPQDLFIDMNTYCIPKLLAVQVSPVLYRKFREPGAPEIDRVLSHTLRQIAPNYDCTYRYSVNYAVASNSELSVKPEFFEKGNRDMLERYKGELPWKK